MARKVRSLQAEARGRVDPLAFVAVDLETTGLNWQNDRIIEVGAVRVDGGRVAKRFQSLVRPDRKVPAFVVRLTGIRPEELKDAPAAAAVIADLQAFAGGLPLVFHNARFDYAFLEQSAPFANLRWDTLPLARCLLPAARSHGLAGLCRAFGIGLDNHHRADADAMATAEIFLALLALLEAQEPPVLEKLHRIGLEEHRALIREVQELKRSGGTFGLSARLAGLNQDYAFRFDPGQPGSVDERDSAPSVSACGNVAEIFDAGGRLDQALGESFEHRGEQLQMAQAVDAALRDEHFLCAEAGTGTGKSLAYLAPAALWAARSEERVVVATHTKLLQEQLYYKDIPLLARATGPFRAALLKGRNNYLCLRRWREALFHPELMLAADEREEALVLVPWAERTATGDIAEHRGFSTARAPGLWAKVCSDPASCQGGRCPQFGACFLMKARRRAEQAEILVINHSLLFTDLVSDNRLLPEYQRLVVDEAHNIERVATDFLGYGLNRWELSRFLAGLYSRTPAETGLLVTVNRAVGQAGMPVTATLGMQRSVLGIVQVVAEAARVTERFFGIDLRRHLERQEKRRYLAGDGLQNLLLEEAGELIDHLGTVAERLALLNQWLSEVRGANFEEIDGLRQELHARGLEAKGLADRLGDLVLAEQQGFIFWVEPANDYSTFKLVAAPLEVSRILADKLYPHLKTLVFTSATLAVEGRFDFFTQRTGLALLDQDRVVTMALASPFDFQSQASLMVPGFLPSPKDKAFDSALIKLLQATLRAHRAGTLVLFTSFELLNKCYDKVSESGEIRVLAQGRDGLPVQLVEQSLAEPNTVIFGTSSFWEGVDLPGEALELLVIVKLPFAVPTDPLVQARCQLIDQGGGSSFTDYLLPEAVIRFRQGFGRLIRSKSDQGVVIVADSRIVNNAYGSAFIRSLPRLPVVVSRSEEELLEGLASLR
jgi:predicted DnaQ family exonuclease/DinG family helicase